MYKSNKNIVVAIIAALSIGITSGGAWAGGFLDVEFDANDFTTYDPLIISNPYWPLRPDSFNRTFTYIGETEDECVIVQIEVTNATHLMTVTDNTSPYYNFTALEVTDTEWVFEDEPCDLLLPPAAIKEKTQDWYAQDFQGNIWYLGERSQSFENDEDEGLICGPYPGPLTPDDACFEGSWEAGITGGEGDDEAVVGVAGIVVPSDEPIAGEPLENGNYFMQEVAFEAEDMAKIKRQHASLSVEDSVEPGEYEDCRKTKEWTALEPGGSVEHKWYCADGPGLVLIEGVGGGPTEVEVLVDVVVTVPLP